MRRIFSALSLVLVVVFISTLSGCMLPQVVIHTDRPSNTLSPTTRAPAITIAPKTSDAITQAPAAASAPLITLAAATGEAVAPILPGLGDIIARVRPSVVAINTTAKATSIFGSTFNQEGAGSGFIIDSGGTIVTNNHVVEGADVITVTLEDNRSFTANTVHTDSVSDLAVLKIDATNLPAVRFGDSVKSRVGDWVIAIGNSLGEGISATKGIVSAKGVSVTADNGETLYDLIQTDAAINPGNSGGPLVNLAGDVIGINSIKVVRTGVEGMGYAISGQTALPIINELLTNGYVARPWLGVKLYEVDAYAINQLNLKVDKGVLLTEVVAGGPAVKAGMKKYDVITAFDGQDVSSVQSLVKLIRAKKPGDSVSITCWRGDTQLNLTLTLEPAPPPA